MDIQSASTIAPDDGPTRIFNAAFTSVFVANMLMQLAMQMMNSVMAKYIDSLGAPATTVGFVMGMFAYTALAFKFVSAPAIDSLNKKHLLTGAMLLMAISYVGYSLSRSVHAIMVFRLIQGASQAFTATTCLALATDSLPQDKLGTGIGFFSLAQAACQAFGPVAGLYLSTIVGYNMTFATGAAILVAAAIASSNIKTRHIPRKFALSLSSVVAKEAMVPALINLFLASVFFSVNSFLIIYADRLGIGTEIGYYFTIYALTLLFTRPMVGRLSDKYGTIKVLIPAMCCFAASFFIISFATTLWMFFVAAFVAAFGFGASGPVVQTLCMKAVPPERRGAGSSTNYIGGDLGNLLGPTTAGALVVGFGYPAMWRIMTVPIFAAMLCVFAFRKSIRAADARFSERPR